MKSVLRLAGLCAVLLMVCAKEAAAYQFVRASNPARTIVNSDSGAWRATFTDGSYTVRHHGPSRTFSEPVMPGVTIAPASVTHTSYVRVMSAPWPSGKIPTAAEVDALLARTDPDMFAVAMQYIYAAPIVSVPDPAAYTGFRRISGDAAYGTAVGSDFNDYMGIAYNYGSWGGIDPNETHEYGQLDCSGFIRMVFGERMGMVLAKMGYERPGVAIPRTSALQASNSGVGTVIIADTGAKPTALGNLAQGDVVFFDSDGNDGVIDHVGIYLGVDSNGHNRVLSSRISLQGPTMNDAASGNSPSTLNGSGWMPSGFRSARRF